MVQGAGVQPDPAHGLVVCGRLAPGQVDRLTQGGRADTRPIISGIKPNVTISTSPAGCGSTAMTPATAPPIWTTHYVRALAAGCASTGQ